MATPVKIDFVSDVVCPWCVIGMKELQAAVSRSADVLTAKIRFQPFELNPELPPGGEDLFERIKRKYGASREETEASQARTHARAASLGFEIRSRERIYNTFNAHRLLHWAGLEGRQAETKLGLFEAYFTRGESLDDPEVLVRAAEAAGLAGHAARDVVSSGRYAAEVRAAQRRWRELGVNSVPSIVIDDKHLIVGSQPAPVFEDALRKVAARA